jgi:hypothetical protein
VNAKPLAVQKSPSAKSAKSNTVFSHPSGDICRWIRRIRNYDEDGLGRRLRYLRYKFTINLCVLFKEPKSSLRIAPIDRSARLLVDAGSDQYYIRALKIAKVPVEDVDPVSDQNAAAYVGRDGLGRLSSSIHEHDLGCASSYDGRHYTCATNIPCPNDPDLHVRVPRYRDGD